MNEIKDLLRDIKYLLYAIGLVLVAIWIGTL